MLKLFIDNIIFCHGAPRKFITDRESNFTSTMMKEICCILNINKAFTSSYHPQTDGFVERVNGILIQSLALYVRSQQVDWDIFLPSVVYAYNTSISETTGDTPFFLTYGREPIPIPDTSILPPTNLSPSVVIHRQRIISQLQMARDMA